MLDRTRSHKFVIRDTNSSSVVVVVICVFKVFTTRIRGIFVINLVVEEDKNLSKNASISFLKKKIRAKKKSLFFCLFDYF